MLRTLFLCLAFLAPDGGLAQTVTFAPTDSDIVNPERGWWLFASGDFITANEQEIAAVRAEGVTVAYGIARLDAWRDADLPPDVLAGLEQRLAWARKHGIKIILRFAYNYPASSQEYEDAQDAPLPQVLRHIAQLGPVIAASADTVVVLQGGFIGAWGEAHTSSNGLDTPESKAAIRDALYAAIPDSIPLQWRYPPDILSWAGDRRMGFHNDCFLSSPTDVGTYDEDPSLRAAQRAAMAALTDNHYFSGETCDAQEEQIRTSCDAILAEGAEFHLSSLNKTYFMAFHAAWKTQGCYGKISHLMGYRLQLDGAVIDGDTVDLTLTNTGWARPVQPRVVVLAAYKGGAEIGRGPFSGAVSDIGPGETVTLSGTLAGLAQADRICLSAPDNSPRLAADPSFAIRFANADAVGQSWDAKAAAYCFAR